jgi:hypothetical protein
VKKKLRARWAAGALRAARVPRRPLAIDEKFYGNARGLCLIPSSPNETVSALNFSLHHHAALSRAV